jgi:phosphoglycerol transferase MdoB-like AlkP superfamily enzyme
MRTEFTVLTGLRGEALGPWFFHPYLLASRRPVWSVAWHLRAGGYAALCLHPYRKDFFRRDRAMPHLGFERFWGLKELKPMETFGPYASDAALGRKILEELHAAERPLFCFAITIEAHGPWLRGRLTEDQIAACLNDVDRRLFSEKMQLYLCHLRHMDALFGMLRQDGAGNGRKVEVWAYGDHAPGLGRTAFAPAGRLN